MPLNLDQRSEWNRAAKEDLQPLIDEFIEIGKLPNKLTVNLRGNMVPSQNFIPHFIREQQIG